MLVLGLHSKDRMSTKDKVNICNPKVNRGSTPLTANRISADCVQISLGPPIQYIPLRVYRTGGFNAMQFLIFVTRVYCISTHFIKGRNRDTWDFPSHDPGTTLIWTSPHWCMGHRLTCKWSHNDEHVLEKVHTNVLPQLFANYFMTYHKLVAFMIL